MYTYLIAHCQHRNIISYDMYYYYYMSYRLSFNTLPT